MRPSGTTSRLFAAITPPPEVVDSLAHFLAPRWEADPVLRWVRPEQWHLTLAFLPAVPETSLDDLVARLARAGRRRSPMELQLAGAGVFPDVYSARVLFVEPIVGEQVDIELHRLAAGVRSAASRAGASPQGGRFRPHLTVARSSGPFEATRWIRVLHAWRGPEWIVHDFHLYASELGAGDGGRPRYTRLGTFPIG